MILEDVCHHLYCGEREVHEADEDVEIISVLIDGVTHVTQQIESPVYVKEQGEKLRDPDISPANIALFVGSGKQFEGTCMD